MIIFENDSVALASLTIPPYFHDSQDKPEAVDGCLNRNDMVVLEMTRGLRYG